MGKEWEGGGDGEEEEVRVVNGREGEGREVDVVGRRTCEER